MTTYICVLNRAINCFINVMFPKLNSNNFLVIIYVSFFVFIAPFVCYFNTPFLFLLILLFQLPFFISNDGTATQTLKVPIIKLQKEADASGIRWIEKTFLYQIKFIEYDLKKKNRQSFEDQINFQKKIFNTKLTLTLLRI